VYVNRVWLGHFGRGIVGTPSDFGTRGDRPTHPELLDYLAVRFMEEGWSIKKLHRLIMTSAVYQQSSEDRPSGRAIDSENTLLWKMNRRLDFEGTATHFVCQRPAGSDDWRSCGGIADEQSANDLLVSTA
jgi:hypothetical protein